MLWIFTTMFAAAALGFTLRKRPLPRKKIGHSVSVMIPILMAMIGIEIGASPAVVEIFGQIIGYSVALTAAALIGTWVAAAALNRWVLHLKAQPKRKPGKKHSNASSFWIICAFAVGAVVGLNFEVPFSASSYATYALYILMALVGFSIGSDTAILVALKNQSWRAALLPIATIVGTLGGVWLFSPLISLATTDQLAVGSGFAYYSLSSVLLGELRGPTLGAIALLANILRELVTVTAAPWIVRRISPAALISSGGATTLDITLPVITRYIGPKAIPVAVFHGVVVDLSVPLLVAFFASI